MKKILIPCFLVTVSLILMFLPLGIVPWSVAQTDSNYTSTNERIQLSYERCMRLSKDNHPDILVYEMEQQEADIEIEKQLTNKRRTEIIDYQQELMEQGVANKKEDKYDELEKSVIERYDGVLLAAARERIAIKTLEYTKDSLQTAQDSYNRGLIDSIQLQRAREQVTIKQQELAEATQLKRQATYMLLLVTNLPLDSRIELTDSIEPITDVIDFDNAVTQLSRNNRNIHLLTIQMTLNQLLYEASLENTMQSADDRELARLAYEKSRIQLDKIKRELRNGLFIAHLNVQTKYEAIRTARIQYQVAANSYATDRDKLIRGIISEDAVQQSEIMMMNMRLNFLNKISEFNKSVITYQQLLD